MRARWLINLICVGILAGCAMAPAKLAEPGSGRLGIAQTARGQYAVCAQCPLRTLKTPYGQVRDTVRGDAADESPIERTENVIRKSEHSRDDAETRPSSGSPDSIGPMPRGEVGGPAAIAQPLLTLRFPFDVARLQDEHRQALHDFARDVWPTIPAGSLLVVGHTDDIGPKSYNDRLARRRAENVADALRELGATAVRADGAGKCCYVAGNESPTGRALNRRVEIRLSTHEEHHQ